MSSPNATLYICGMHFCSCCCREVQLLCGETLGPYIPAVRKDPTGATRAQDSFHLFAAPGSSS